MNCPIDIHTPSGWQRIGEWIADPGERQEIRSSGRWCYDLEWVLNHLDEPWAAASLALPLSLDSIRMKHWPAFLLDLLPTGPARDHWLELLGVRNGKGADWPLLQHAGRAPVGNLRLSHARDWKPDLVRGFSREEVLSRGSHFLEFMRQAQETQFGVANDSPYSAVDTQGAAPKYLLTQDKDGLWWAEGTLEDQAAVAFWLVKFPKGETRLDRLILKSEGPCLEIARVWGLRCASSLTWEQDTLFVPRFDRQVKNGAVVRFGLESLCSSLGVAEFGHDFRHEELCEAIHRFSSSPSQDLLEYLGRDVLNLALGNSDNHARNTAFLKDGPDIRLSPLYDICPMELDPQGIRRACRWAGERPLRPDWTRVREFLSPWVSPGQVTDYLRTLAHHVRRLPETSQALGLPEEVVGHCRPRWEVLAQDLELA